LWKTGARWKKNYPPFSVCSGLVICWIHYPKGSSGIQTDLTRDKGWENLLKENLHWLSLISFNETWSAFGMRLKTEADELKKPNRWKGHFSIHRSGSQDHPSSGRPGSCL
jgi:hypothetical protein